MAISVRNGDNVTIEKNTISDALATGDGGQGYGIMIGYPKATNNRVADNVVRGPAMRHGILLQYGTHHNLVEHNTVTRTTTTPSTCTARTSTPTSCATTTPRTAARAASASATPAPGTRTPAPATGSTTTR